VKQFYSIKKLKMFLKIIKYYPFDVLKSIAAGEFRNAFRIWHLKKVFLTVYPNDFLNKYINIL
jgi:hypothetical protein